MTTTDKIKDDSPPKKKQTWKNHTTGLIDMEVLKTMDFKDKVFYLAMCGWKIETELRSGNEYLYAVKYIDRKKKRIYMGKKLELTFDNPLLFK